MGSPEQVELKAKLVPRNFVRNRGNGRWYIETFWVLEGCTPAPTSGFVVDAFDGFLPKHPPDLDEFLGQNKGILTLRTRPSTPEDEESEMTEPEHEEGGPDTPLEANGMQPGPPGPYPEQGFAETAQGPHPSYPPAKPPPFHPHSQPPPPPPSPVEQGGGTEGAVENVEILSFVYPIEEGEPLGLVLDDNMAVVKVQKGTVAEESILLGDIVLKLNGKEVKTQEEYYKLLRRCFPSLRIELKRDQARQAELAARLLPPHLERIVNRRPGHDYFVVVVDCAGPPPRPLGMAIDTLHNRVIITKLVAGAAAEGGVALYDRIVGVDGEPVSDKDVAKRMILDRGGRFEGLIERATDPVILEDIKTSIQQKACLPVAQENEAWAAFDMPSDVQDIAKSERERRSKEAKAAKTVLHRVPSREHRPITIAAEHKEVQICSDIDPNKQLRKPAPI